jgi:HEAT repeat protein
LPKLAELAVTDAVADVRRAAVGALGMLGSGEVEPHRGQLAADALIQSLSDSDWTVREEAAATLGKLRLDKSAKALLRLLDDPYWQVRLKSVRALGRLRASSAISPIGRLLDRQQISNLRKEAAIALGEIGDPAGLPYLAAAETDPDPEVRKLARLARDRLGGEGVGL